MIKVAKNQSVQTKPEPLEVHKDTVNFDLSGNLPAKLLKKGTSYTLNTFYKYGENEIALPPLVFKAEDYPNNGTEQIAVTKAFSFPYKDAFVKTNGTVEIQGVAAKGTKTLALPKKGEPRPVIGTGIIATSKLVQKSYYAAFAEHGYNNQEELTPVIIPDFNFERGKSVLRKSEVTADKGKQLDAFIAAKNITKTVTITGTHSPEGLERINSKLSEERAAVIEKFYRDEMKKYDYQGVAADIKFILKPIVDDWNGFKTALAAYEGIAADEKTAYLDVINSGGTFEDQEKGLKKLKTYNKVFKDVYPGLRAAKTEILTVKSKKTDAEISVLAKQMTKGEAGADALTFEELMYSATLTPSLDEKAAIYEAATKKGSNWAALRHRTNPNTSAVRAKSGRVPSSVWLSFPIARIKIMNQVNRMISGAPLSIWSAPSSEAKTSARPPFRQPASICKTTHGMRPRAAMLFGYIRQFSVRPLKEKATPATAAAKWFLAQRKARKYIPSPARKRCARQKKLSDHGSGSKR